MSLQEPAWSEGYVVGVDYTAGYYRSLAPSTLRFVALLGGLEAPEADQPFTYYELGCGNGRSATLHAAANPLGQFIGVDFNPTHVHNARRFAQDCGLGNVRFLENSFAELGALDLPDAEFIALHGVYSWVGAEARGQIVDFIRRRLKPGGMAFVSYNCLPGLGPIAPLQRLLHDHAAQGSGSLPERVEAAVRFATRLGQLGADYFGANPMAQNRLAQIARHDSRYVAHEYFNASWTPFFHADVARELAEAKLVYAGSADFIDNFVQFALKPEIAQLVAGLRDRVLAETAIDFARNQLFRRDVYTRGAPRRGAAQLDQQLARSRFALGRPREECQLQRATPAGQVTLEAGAYAPVLDALARGPMTFDDLARAPETAGLDRGRLRQAVFGMAAFGNVLPALPEAGEGDRRVATRRYNKAALAARAAETAHTALASPVLGAGITLASADPLPEKALPFLRSLAVVD